MNKDFDIKIKMEKGNAGYKPAIASIAYCTPGCKTGETCGTSECGISRNCTGSWLCY